MTTTKSDQPVSTGRLTIRILDEEKLMRLSKLSTVTKIAKYSIQYARRERGQGWRNDRQKTALVNSLYDMAREFIQGNGQLYIEDVLLLEIEDNQLHLSLVKQEEL